MTEELDLTVNQVGRIPDLEAEVIERAAESREFYNKLVADPKAAMAEFGVDIPEGLDIQVLQETETTHYLVLPAVLATAAGAPQGELSDQALEAVVGGGDTDQTGWTGCGSGRSGCVASSGCTIALEVVKAVASAAGA